MTKRGTRSRKEAVPVFAKKRYGTDHPIRPVRVGDRELEVPVGIARTSPAIQELILAGDSGRPGDIAKAADQPSAHIENSHEVVRPQTHHGELAARQRDVRWLEPRLGSTPPTTSVAAAFVCPARKRDKEVRFGFASRRARKAANRGGNCGG